MAVGKSIFKAKPYEDIKNDLLGLSENKFQDVLKSNVDFMWSFKDDVEIQQAVNNLPPTSRLLYAVDMDNINVAKQLFKEFDLDLFEKFKILIRAVDSNSPSIAQYLVNLIETEKTDIGSDNIIKAMDKGHNLVNRAIFYKNWPLVGILLKSKYMRGILTAADVLRLLSIGYKNGNRNMVKYLLKEIENRDLEGFKKYHGLTNEDLEMYKKFINRSSIVKESLNDFLKPKSEEDIVKGISHMFDYEGVKKRLYNSLRPGDIICVYHYENDMDSVIFYTSPDKALSEFSKDVIDAYNENWGTKNIVLYILDPKVGGAFIYERDLLTKNLVVIASFCVVTGDKTGIVQDHTKI